MRKIIIFILYISFLSCSFEQGKEDFLDNPTAEAITFELNGKSYTLEAFSTQKVKRKIGKNTLKTPSGHTIEFETDANNPASIINPSGSEYVVYAKLFYFSKDEISYKILFDRYKGFFQNVDLNQKKYFAPMSVTNEFYIDASYYKWNYGLGEDFESEIPAQKLEEWQKKLNFSELFKVKIFRADDFLNQYGMNIWQIEENPLEN